MDTSNGIGYNKTIALGVTHILRYMAYGMKSLFFNFKIPCTQDSIITPV